MGSWCTWARSAGEICAFARDASHACRTRRGAGSRRCSSRNLPAQVVTPVLLEHWRGSTAKTRNVLLNTFFSDQKRLPGLLEAIKKGTIQPWALGPARTRQLLQHSDPAIKQQAQTILSDPASDRKAVYEKYLPAITGTGRPERGREVFEKSLRRVPQGRRNRRTSLVRICAPSQNDIKRLCWPMF